MSIADKKTGETSHEGRVVGTHTARSVRIMSDVWADLHYVVVHEPTREYTGVCSTETDWNAGRDPETDEYPRKPKGVCGTIRMIQVSNTEFPHNKGEGFAYEVDATEEALAAYEGWKLGILVANKLHEYASNEYEARQRRQRIEKGAVVRVTKGRKVPKGTEGTVFWLGDNGYGTSVGIGIPNEDGTYEMITKSGRNGKIYESYKNVAWTAINNVQRITAHGGRIL